MSKHRWLLAWGLGSIAAGGAVATRFGFTVAFGGAGVVLVAVAALVLVLRGLSAQTKVVHEPPLPVTGED